MITLVPTPVITEQPPAPLMSALEPSASPVPSNDHELITTDIITGPSTTHEVDSNAETTVSSTDQSSLNTLVLGLGIGAILGIAAGILLIVLIVIMILIVVINAKRKKRKLKVIKSEHVPHLENLGMYVCAYV